MRKLSKHDKQMDSKILLCLENLSSKSLQEITNEYNRRYPPTLLLRIIGAKKKPTTIKLGIDRLLADKLLTKRILSYTDQPLTEPEAFYTLSQKGIQKLAERGKKKS
jgi:hypothetical protein